MKSLLIFTSLVVLTPMSAHAALQQGDTAPPFSAQASLAGKEFTFSLGDALKKGPLVVYFFPSAYTQGCNVQAHTFAMNHEKFAEAGATVVGVSLDPIGRLNEFSADPEFCAGKLAVASDADGKVVRLYELQIREAPVGMKDTRNQEIQHGFAERTTFVVTPDGKIAATIGGVSPFDNVRKALETVEQLKNAGH